MSNSPGTSDGCPRSRAAIIRFALILVGLAGSNNIKGTARKDVIYAGGGNDTIQAPSGPGNQGNDIICGGPGNDKIIGNGDSAVPVPDDLVVAGAAADDVIALIPGTRRRLDRVVAAARVDDVLACRPLDVVRPGEPHEDEGEPNDRGARARAPIAGPRRITHTSAWIGGCCRYLRRPWLLRAGG